ncbi:hypothetical protein M422DRAFT_144437, partial [Sphaerobolus stellatus SS14]
LPPGPRAFPLIGNAFELPSSREYFKYSEWGKKCGDVSHLTAFGKHIVLLNSTKACVELLEQRSAIYSERPPCPIVDEPD